MPPGPIHLSTILSQTPSGLLSHLTRLSIKYGNQGHTVLFTLSANFPHPEDLQAIVKKLTSFNDVPDSTTAKRIGKARGHTLGCLSDSFAAVGFPKLNSPGTKTSDVLSCSVGIFDSAHCIPFHSEIAGRTQPQVGRWHAFRKQNEDISSDDSSFGEPGRQDWERMKDSGDGEVNWENIWNRSTKSSPSSVSSLLPESLKKIESSQIRALVSLSSSHPDTFTRVLSDYISSNKLATSLTLVAAPTHFVTGRAVTLFMDGEIYSEGAVGLALLLNSGKTESSTDAEDRNTGPGFRAEFAGMTKLSGPMTVTSREGNMINALNDSNPTGLLLSALDLAGIGAAKDSSSSSPFSSTFKDDEQFALGLLAPDGNISETYKITAGDPSSRGGSLSLDAPRAPGLGSVVQFLHCPANTPLALSPALLSPSVNTETPKIMAFLSVPEIVTKETTGEDNDTDTDRVFENMFIAPSTQGFIVSLPSTSTLCVPEDTKQPVEVKDAPSEPWSCSLPGVIALLEW